MDTLVLFIRKTFIFPILLVFLIAMGCSALKSGDNGVPRSKKKFHLYLLIGQSNMAGRGVVEQQDKEAHPRVFMLNKENQWVPAIDPVHFDKTIAGVGPGLTFGKVMAENEPGVTIGLIPCAAGGSPITVWKKGVWHAQTNIKPYDNAVERVRIAMRDGELKGILWHQGEGDSGGVAAVLYERRLHEFIMTLKKDLGTPDVPFVAGLIGDFYVGKTPGAVIVNEALANMPRYVKNAAVVEVKGLTPKEDGVHFDAASARELGRRYAEALLKLER